jgi:N-acetylmuramoyl-L-alanine amidase
VRFHWLLPSILSVFVLSSTAEAAKLRSWRFDANQNRLQFNTDGSVQPKAKLIFNPTRLVIDLPGTTLQRSTVKQEYGGAVRSVRVGQFNENTTRIAIELSPGYKLDPNQVKVRGVTPSQWTVQLPVPQKVAVAPSTNRRPLPLPQSVRPNNSEPRKIFTVVTTSEPPNKNSSYGRTSVNATAVVQIHNIQVTDDGLFVRTRGGGTPSLNVSRSRDRSQISIDLRGAALSPLAAPNTPVNRFGVGNIKLAQVQSSPPVVRMTMQVNKSSPDWEAAVSRFGGVTVLPVGGINAVRRNNAIVAETTNNSSAQPVPGVATIESVELNSDGSQLLIKTDQSLTYTSGWDRSSGLYRITFAGAQLARAVKGPNLNTNSPLLRVRLQQPTPRTVLISVLPAAGVRVGELNQPTPELLSLQLPRSSGALFPPSTPSTNPDVVTIPTTPPPNTPLPSSKPRTVGQKRIIVVIDPGHGGKDPGAIGIGGLQEKNIILPISQKIAAILEQKGIQVVMTRDSDYFVDLGPRTVMADRVNANLFVSIHANSMPANRSDINGLETYYYDSGQRLARVIHNSILGSINIRDRGVRKARFYVLRKSSMPSVLVEVGFVTGVVDAPRLGTAAYQNQMAEAVARGILQYLQQN